MRDLAALYKFFEYAGTGLVPHAAMAPIPPASQFSEVIYGSAHDPAAKVRMHWARLLSQASAGPLFTKRNPPQASEQEDFGRTRGRSRIATLENVPIATWNNICKAVKISRTDVSLSNGCSDGDVLTAAWAVAIAFVGRPDDVVFGRDVNGQQALTNNIAHGDRIVGTVMKISLFESSFHYITTWRTVPQDSEQADSPPTRRFVCSRDSRYTICCLRADEFGRDCDPIRGHGLVARSPQLNRQEETLHMGFGRRMAGLASLTSGR